jgi:hypothetical protein
LQPIVDDFFVEAGNIVNTVIFMNADLFFSILADESDEFFVLIKDTRFVRILYLHIAGNHFLTSSLQVWVDDYR